MKNFTYINATSKEAAVGSLGDKALALAGGTDVLNLMKERVIGPDTLVNIKSIPGLNAIRRVDGGGLAIGANVKLTDLLDYPDVQHSYPALHQALYEAATPQIRNMSTLGGNLCARPRCWYFRMEGSGCRKIGGDGCPALDGDNEFHAIFGIDGPCVMVHPSSAAPALVAYGATLGISGPDGDRTVGIEEFFTMPSTNIDRENILKSAEILTQIYLPKTKPTSRSATYDVRHKASHDWPLSLASVVLELDGNVVRDARICLGAVAPTPWRVPAAEALLRGSRVTEGKAAEAGSKAVEGATPLSQNRYKIQLTRTAVKRAILAAASGRREW